MTGTLYIGGRPAGMVQAFELHTPEERTVTITGNVERLNVGARIRLDGEFFLIAGSGAGQSQRTLFLQAIEHKLVLEAAPERGQPKFGGDRPYLKKKKGRS